MDNKNTNADFTFTDEWDAGKGRYKRVLSVRVAYGKGEASFSLLADVEDREGYAEPAPTFNAGFRAAADLVDGHVDLIADNGAFAALVAAAGDAADEARRGDPTDEDEARIRAEYASGFMSGLITLRGIGQDFWRAKAVR